MPTVRVPPGDHRPHELLARAGLARSRSDAVRLLRQGAVRRDGMAVGPAAELRLAPGASFVLSIGPSRFVRIEAEGGEGKDRGKA